MSRLVFTDGYGVSRWNMIQEKKNNNLLVLAFFAAMFFMYFMRYFTHEMTLDTPGYRGIALAATGAFMAGIFIFFFVLLKKTASENRLIVLLWMGLYAGVNFGTFVPKHILGSVYLYIAMVYFLMTVSMLSQKCIWLLPFLYVFGIYLYPGFYLLAMPPFLGLTSLDVPEEKQAFQKRFQIVSLLALLAGTACCIYRAFGNLPFEDPYGVLMATRDYGYFWGLFDNITTRIIEAAVFFLFMLPILIILRKGRKTRKFLIPFFPILVEAVVQVHLGICVYYLFAGGLLFYLYKVFHEEYYAEAIRYRWGTLKEKPGIYILYLYPFALTPFYINHICRATQWIAEHITALFG